MIKYFYLPFLLLLVFSCTTNSAQQSLYSKTIPANEFSDSMKAKKDFQLVDVRTPEEFAEGHLPDARNIDFEGNDFEKNIQALDKAKPTFIYCRSGNRSAGAMEVMVKTGFREVYNLKGGIKKWNASQFPVENSTTALPPLTGTTRAEYDKLTQSEIPVLFDFQAK